jgi:hypothetical protein
MTEMASLVLYAASTQSTAAFYRALGVTLADEDHGEGPVHFATELGPVHFAIYPAEQPGQAQERRSGGRTCRQQRFLLAVRSPHPPTRPTRPARHRTAEGGG